MADFFLFFMAISPLFAVLAGIILFRLSGATMAIIGLVITGLLAMFLFHTPLSVIVGATLFGIVKALGITLAVAATMFLIFLMAEMKALDCIATKIKTVAQTQEEQALFIGMGFGSFVTALGAVTPALFPPLLVALGFSPFTAASVAILGYDPLTSFALLSLPITLPAEVSHTLISTPFNAEEFALKITLFLPIISIGLAIAIVWIVSGWEGVKRNLVAAMASGLTLSLSAIFFVLYNILPVRVVGIASGLLCMAVLFIIMRNRKKEINSNETCEITDLPFFTAAIPWIVLIILAAIVSFPSVEIWLKNAPGSSEVITVFANKTVDLNILSNIYTWISFCVLVAIAVYKPSKKQLSSVANKWIKKAPLPFIAYSLFFSISFVMAFSAMEVANGKLTPNTELYQSHNMNIVVGQTLAEVFGHSYIFVAALLGLFGAVVGGSETSSNVMFMTIQYETSKRIGLAQDQFLTLFGAHASAGGIASAITPAKINNAVATLDIEENMEGAIMKKHLYIALSLSIITSIVCGILINLRI